MKDTALMSRLQAYGADIDGIESRFMGDYELYEKCFVSLLEERNFGLLESAVESSDYTAAFESAHALKGLSGNLGLTPLYKDICVLVESLRVGRHDNLSAESKTVILGYQQLLVLAGLVPGLCDSIHTKP